MFGVIACMLIIDVVAVGPLIQQDANLVYARDPGRGVDPIKGSPTSVPEPSTLVLLGVGAAGIGIYLYSKYAKNRR